MSFNPEVTRDMVSFFKISEDCIETDPCQHKCTITLSDGREKNVTLDGITINSLIHTIASEKIPAIEDEKTHFNCCAYEEESPEELLTKIFN